MANPIKEIRPPIRKDGLIFACPACKKKGFVVSEKWRKWLESNSTSKPPKEPKQTKCEDCNGFGWYLTKHGDDYARLMEMLYPSLVRAPIMMDKDERNVL